MALLSFTGRNVPDDPSKGWIVAVSAGPPDEWSEPLNEPTPGDATRPSAQVPAPQTTEFGIGPITTRTLHPYRPPTSTRPRSPPRPAAPLPDICRHHPAPAR
ncbi:hypothetical protein GCM10009760_17860 [Kitasatospora kazusensis]|uniref:Uncharacterized protein n=1 Tax=Kitasatospora kazusensis TaxID=407974 RepID=A0ABN2Z659_9ACTN